MSDIFQEVDEDVRRDKALEFWTKYQNYVLALALLIVVGVAGWRFWQYRETQTQEAAGAAFQNALTLDSQGKTDEARAALSDVVKSGASGYALLGAFVDASLAEKKDPKSGATAFDALANQFGVDPLLRDAAKLRAALARLKAGETDAAKSALTPLAAAGPYRSTANLTLAALAISAKDYGDAGKRLDAVIGDANAPLADRRSAQTLLGLVASQTAHPSAAPAAAPSAIPAATPAAKP